ncbi:mitochondrial ribosomal protein MRP51 [Exophiala viscosa]|uniref:Mitochondrial ribosomal protein MRP51 n=1 Tax=Exophiala viscosa TaxID=2486360 RepID=A0AAN6E924_9EURO|nr:mitochondrial ribosomal protein MRP51 [Exophiala viscosa]KAI1628082.1 mitochondrial ribosomal protein MRP51 [Exophiala viscosa]
MTAARLSPAASLLRSSKLFALPPQLSLPPTPPSADPPAYSDTATTPYPIRPAIETPTSSLNQGDWGLKRALPIKTTTKSGTPVIRIQGGIDTQEHIADFESAADHVLTLRKFQELQLRVTLPTARDVPDSQRTSAFHPEVDHTTDVESSTLVEKATTSWLEKSPLERVARLPKHLKDTLDEVARTRTAEAGFEKPAALTSPAQAPFTSTKRRWRYAGPYLAGMNGMEFESFLNKITREQRIEFRAYVKQHLINERLQKHRAEALEQGETDTAELPSKDATEEEVTEYLRHLRSEPGKFGPLIASFFDLADAPNPSPGSADPWSYGRDTISADSYRESGPPTTHPSAGLSYIKSEKFSRNDTKVGPLEHRPPVPARLLKSIPTSHRRYLPRVGVAGFVVPPPTGDGFAGDYSWQWEPKKDGPKLVVTPNSGSVSQAGKLEMTTKLEKNWLVEDDVPVNKQEKSASQVSAARRSTSTQLPPLDGLSTRRPNRRVTRPPPEPSQDISEEWDMLVRTAAQNAMSKQT